MDQIRFSRPVSAPIEPNRESAIKPDRSGLMKVLLKAVVLLVIIAVVVFGGFYFWKNMKGSSVAYDPTASDYYAVFLSNGQVYFGVPVSKNGAEFVLKDVYYLQVSDNTASAQDQLTEPRFSLVKLGQEIHGPTDKLYVNMTNVLFYEQLKNDSKVVESIKNQK